ncbi:MAG: MFS transporter, partial [Clostridia bacterium]|nr:MFS transporter [Clostridia bacterium]
MPDNKKKKSGILRHLGYGVGAVGLDLSYGMFYSYLNKYLTDVLKLSSNFLLILTPLARIWDGINDPMMGTIVDSSKFRMGKYRPWILIGSISNAVILALLFNNLFGLSGTSLYVYIAVMYVFWGMTNTLADIPYWSMVPSFTNDPAERSIIATIARTFSGLGQGIISIGAPILMGFVSITTDPNTGEKVFDERTFMI